MISVINIITIITAVISKLCVVIINNNNDILSKIINMNKC